MSLYIRYSIFYSTHNIFGSAIYSDYCNREYNICIAYYSSILIT